MNKEKRNEYLYLWKIITLADYLARVQTTYTIEDCRDWNPAILGF
jgi:hypothetical protein